MARFDAFRVSLCLAAATLTACGGGGGGSSSSVLPATSGPGSTGDPGSAPASVAISIAIPPASAASAARRRARYISAATKSIVVSYAGSRQIADCTTMCNLTLSVAPGTVTFTISLFDAAGGGGNVLSTGTTTAAVAQGKQNIVAITFGGVVAKVGLSLGTTTVTAGSAATIPVTVTAQDAAGYTIVGSDPYATAIVLADDDRTGATALSTSSVAAPGVPVTLAYNGSANVGAVHLSASVPGATFVAPTATLSVQSPAAPNPPAGSVPLHETTWYYYGLNGTNASIPASWMAAHADYVEDDGNTAQHAEAFKDAGGKYAVSYTDPAYVPYCSAPFAPPAGQCGGQVGSLAASESAWFHAADGTRVRRFMSDYFKYQEALNPASQAARDAWHLTTTKLLASAPKLDYFFADDSGGIFIGDDGTQMLGWMYGFSAPAVEITTDAAFIAAERQYLAAAARPVIINGIDPRTALPSYDGTLLDGPNVAGQNFEGCFSDGSGVGGDTRNNWQHMANGLLATIAHRSNAVCMMMAQATPSNRIYDLASWWMTYSETYSVAAPMNATSDGYTVVPEFEIVPRLPRATATTDIAVLRTPGGAYVREFGACYQAGAPIGPCAAVVNTTGSAVALPPLAGRYANALAVDDKSAYTGGKATWTGAVPAQLAAYSAVVLR